MKLFRKLMSLTLTLLLVSGIMLPAGTTAHAAARAHAETISVNTLPDTLEYESGQKLDLAGLTVKVGYNNDKSDIFTLSELADKNITVSPAHGTVLTEPGKTAVTVSLGDLTDSFEISVSGDSAAEEKITGLSLNTLPDIAEYIPGQKLDLTGLTVKVEYNGERSEIFTLSELADKNITVAPIHGTVLAEPGKTAVTVSLGNLTDSFEITVLSRTLSAISINTPPSVSEYYPGQKLDLEGLTVKLHYSDGSSTLISASDLAANGITVDPSEGTALTETGKTNVTVSSGEHSDSFEVSVLPVTVSAITVNTPPAKLEYIEGEKLDLSGLTVKLHHSDGGSLIFTPDEFADKSITVTPADGTVLAQIGGNTIRIDYKAPDGSQLTAGFEVKVSAAAADERVIDRIFGSTRYETAFAISSKGWNKADTVIIASGENYADALAAAPLAYAADAPILLAGPRDNGTILKEINRLGAKRAYILGGKQAVGIDIETMLTNAQITVTRLGGSDRYATAALIAAELRKLGAKADIAFIVSGESFADALSAGYAAAQKSAPILYTGSAQLSSATAEFITANGIDKVIIIGGEAAVSAQLASALEKITQIARIGGEDRYLTSLAVAAEYFNADGSDRIAVATGKNFPDALTGGAYANRLGVPTLLIGDKPSDELLKYLEQCGTRQIIIFGGENAVSADAADALK